MHQVSRNIVLPRNPKRQEETPTFADIAKKYVLLVRIFFNLSIYTYSDRHYHASLSGRMSSRKFRTLVNLRSFVSRMLI